MSCERIAKIGEDELLFGGWWEGFGCLYRSSQMGVVPGRIQTTILGTERRNRCIWSVALYVFHKNLRKREIMASTKFLRVTLYKRAQ